MSESPWSKEKGEADVLERLRVAEAKIHTNEHLLRFAGLRADETDEMLAIKHERELHHGKERAEELTRNLTATATAYIEAKKALAEGKTTVLDVALRAEAVVQALFEIQPAASPSRN